MTETQAMKRALELAKKGQGKVSPNPLVGAVIIKDGELISEGWHKKFGEAHAEVNAIKNAAERDLRGTTMVLNLEPCSHRGKTPPCADLIIEKKISRVVIAMKDPNPLVAGRGVEKLRRAGVEVETGVMEEQARYLNRFFIKHIVSEAPYIIVKIAQSLDGRIETFGGESQWISCEESRKRSHELRTIADAVLIGKKTALKDNPRLTARLAEGRNPKKILLATNLEIPADLGIIKSSKETDTIICCSIETAKTKKADELKKAGAKILPVETAKDGKINLELALKLLYKQYSIGSIMVEGGAEILSCFLKYNLIDELRLYLAPIIIGEGKSPFEKFRINALKEAVRFEYRKTNQSGRDLEIICLKS